MIIRCRFLFWLQFFFHETHRSCSLTLLFLPVLYLLQALLALLKGVKCTPCCPHLIRNTFASIQMAGQREGWNLNCKATDIPISTSPSQQLSMIQSLMEFLQLLSISPFLIGACPQASLPYQPQPPHSWVNVYKSTNGWWWLVNDELMNFYRSSNVISQRL